jgi:hypothetical protein
MNRKYAKKIVKRKIIVAQRLAERLFGAVDENK